jgi:hypothetical protein
MRLPVESVTVLGTSYEAKAISQVMELIQDAPVGKDIKALGCDTDDDSQLPRLVIATDCDAPARAVEMSQVLFCQHRLWGAVLVVVRGRRLERELGSQSIVGIPGQLLYADSRSFGHGTIDIYSPNFLKLLMDLIEAVAAISPDEFEHYLKQSLIGELRELFDQIDDVVLSQRHFANEEDRSSYIKQMLCVVEKLDLIERSYWDFFVPHHKVNLAMNEIKHSIESCKGILESTEVTTGDLDRIVQQISNFLSHTFLGVSNV